MRKLLFCMVALGAAFLALPASAQTISALSINRDVLVSGEPLTAQFTLTSPQTVDVPADVFALSPAIQVLQPSTGVRIQSGSSGGQVRLQTLPVDRVVRTAIGITVNGQTQWRDITLLPSHPFWTRFLVRRADSGQWFLRDNADGSASTVVFGEPGDQPMPIIFHEGVLLKQLAVYRRRTQEWHIRGTDGRTTIIPFGGPDDNPAPSDYLGTGRTQIAMIGVNTRELLIRNDAGATITVPVPFVQPRDHPVSGDFLGLRRAQFAVYRPSTSEWFIRQDDGTPRVIQFGQVGDAPAPGDYLGLGRVQLAVFRRSTGEWFIRQDDGSALRIPFGQPGDVPRHGDYLASGRTLIGIVRPSTGEWFFRNDTGDAVRIPFGAPGDEFIPDWYGPRLASN